MQPDSVAADPGRKHVVFDLLDRQKVQNHPYHRREWQKHGYYHRWHRRQDRPEHGHQLEQPGKHAQHHGVWQAEQRHADTSGQPDNSGQGELPAQVAAEHTGDVVVKKQRFGAVFGGDGG